MDTDKYLRTDIFGVDCLMVGAQVVRFVDNNNK